MNSILINWKSHLRKHCVKELSIFKEIVEQFLISNVANLQEKKEILNDCAMIATKKGIFNNIKFLIDKDVNILLEKKCGIFRTTSEIESFESFIEIIDYLFIKKHKNFIDINTNKNSFLKDCINKESLKKLKYLIEKHNVLFDFNDETVLKTIIKSDNKEMFDYFFIELKINVHITDSIELWSIENNYKENLEKIKKTNLLVKLSNSLIEKNIKIRNKI